MYIGKYRLTLISSVVVDGGRRLGPQKYVLDSGYVHSDLEPVINLLYPTEREILELTVQYGCCGGISSIAKTSILMRKDSFQN